MCPPSPQSSLYSRTYTIDTNDGSAGCGRTRWTIPDSPHPSPTVFNLIFKRRSLAGSLIGGIQETQDMLDFCARHGIVSDIEMIDIQGINEAYERMLKGDVKYRFVIDMDSLKKQSHAA